MIWDTIKQIREKHDLSQKQFGIKIGVTATYVSYLERPYSKEHKYLPSEDLLRKIAKEFSQSEADRLEMEENLLLERAKLVIAPEIVKDYLLEVKKSKILIGDKGGKGRMPSMFIVKFKKDIQKTPNFYKTSKIPKSTIDAVLKGEQIISREKVISLANDLNQPIEDYLILSGYMPYEFVETLAHSGMISMLRTLSELSPKEKDEMIKAINSIIKVHIKKVD
jgi:transcriptional regulator with XRE-family HTH domain